ncbi:hypothetical protein CHU98_g7119 [Xylaria longipes]|nr:hypothetical protein CHU98_g7119 [Xylaria longipes]
MASPGAGLGPIDIPQETIDAMDVYNEELDADVDKWIKEASYIPKDGDYDYRPLCRALIENHRSAKGVFPDPPSPTPSNNNNNNNNNKRPGGPKDVVKGIQPPEEPLGLAPEPGKEWTHVRYIPAWMDPDYKEEALVTPAGRRMLNTVRDAVYNLRPALRLGDAIRRPTNYALRFGIAADRLDGRSRMSPTWSRTRDPLEPDFFKQIDQLSEDKRQLALKLSLEKWKEMGRQPPPGLEILPDVMEKLLEQHGLMANVGLAAEIEKDAKDGNSFEEMVNHIKSVNPEAFKAHQGFLESLQDDRDYQRMLLLGLTTDELVQNNIHTMSNDVLIDLDNPIHFLFERNRWDNGWLKGQRERSPRNVYNINGTREEYNVVTNDALWDALQPALQLVSMVLSKNPPHLEAIMNMNTRQPIPLKEDQLEDQHLPTLTKYVLEKDIDMSNTYPAIRQLREVHGYDWKKNVLRVLEHTLVLDIDSAYTLAQGYVLDDSITHDAHRGFTFGACATHRKYGPKPGVVPPGEVEIKIKVAADIIWPLLVPQYSKSEKMACSFTIASTLLHELAHAVNQAQELLTMEKWAQQPGQDPEVAKLLMSLDGVVWDVYFGQHEEPFFYDSGVEELGQDFEQSLWGQTTSMMGDGEGMPRHHENLMFALGELTHPIGMRDKRIDAPSPMMRYMRPIPIDYMAKLFTRSFWKEEFGAYGFGALRMMPDNLLQKNLVYEPQLPSKDMDNTLYGKERARFLRAVPLILLKSRQYVLGTYLNALRMEIAYRAQYEIWWNREVQNWEEEILHPLRGSIELLNIELQKTRDFNMHCHSPMADRVSYYRQYLNTMNPDDPERMSYADWQDDVATKWNETVGYGGRLMQSLLVVHNHMRIDMGNMQHMTFYFLAVKPPNAKLMLRDDNDEYTLPGVLYARLETFRDEARRITGMLNYLANYAPLHALKDRWEQWEARFKSNGEQYSALMQMLQESTKVDSEPFDISWKARFDRLPTGSWKHVSEIHKKMAVREYARADPAVRQAIDDYLRNYTNLDLIETSGVKVTDRAEAPYSTSSLHPDSRPGPRLLPRPLGSPQPPRPAPVPTSGYIFGVPGRTPKGGAPPRRITGVQKPTSNARKSTAYQGYVTNLLTMPDPKLASGAAADLFKSGVPQPILDLLPSQKQLSSGSGQTPIQPFPNPYAGRNVMTSVNAEFQQRKEVAENAEKNRQALERAGGVYKAPSLWRERSWDSEKDDDVKMSDVE